MIERHRAHSLLEDPAIRERLARIRARRRADAFASMRATSRPHAEGFAERGSWLSRIRYSAIAQRWLAPPYRIARMLARRDLTIREKTLRIPLAGPLASWGSAVANVRATRHRLTALAQEVHQLRQQASTQGRELRDLREWANVMHEEASTLRRSLRMIERALETTTGDSATQVAGGAAVRVAERGANAFAMGTFYIELEDRFRGAAESIRDRLRPHLERLRPALEGPQSIGRSVDIGCGRGEWLQVLGDAGFRGEGVDTDAAMVEACRARGVFATRADGVAWLRGQAEGSLDLVTAFHVIEHLEFARLVALFDAALRALRTGGAMIAETPNPENVLVGSCNFYLDPTHRNPLPPALVEFVARQRGFARAEIVRINPYPKEFTAREEGELAGLWNRHFAGPQDYALIAWK